MVSYIDIGLGHNENFLFEVQPSISQDFEKRVLSFYTNHEVVRITPFEHDSPDSNIEEIIRKLSRVRTCHDVLCLTNEALKFNHKDGGLSLPEKMNYEFQGNPFFTGINITTPRELNVLREVKDKKTLDLAQRTVGILGKGIYFEVKKFGKGFAFTACSL